MSENPIGEPVVAPDVDYSHNTLCPYWKGEPCQCALIDAAYSARAEARLCEHKHCIREARFCQPHAEEFYLAEIAAEQAAAAAATPPPSP